MSKATVRQERRRLREAEDEVTRASALLSTVGEYAEAHSRGASTDPGAVKRAFDRFLHPGPTQLSARDDQLDHLARTVRDGKDFFGMAWAYLSGANDTSAGGTDLGTLVDRLEDFEANSTSTTKADATTTFETLVDEGSPAISGHLVEIASLLAEAARADRDDARATLNNEYPDGANDGETIASKGAIQDYVDSSGDTTTSLGKHPIALLPVKLETRFVDPPESGKKDGVANPELYADMDAPQLWVRVYPDTVHIDNHEPELTEEEVTFGKDFWAYCWYGTHETLPIGGSESAERTVLENTFDSDRRVDVIAGLDPAAFPSDPGERKTQIKQRAWKQLLDAFGRERAAHVVRALLPETGADAMLSLTADPQGNYPDGVRPESNVPALQFPDPERRADSWTRPPHARCLPDQWMVYGVWVMDDDVYQGLSQQQQQQVEKEETFFRWTNAIREPLPVGPTPEEIALTHPDRGGNAGGTDSDEALEWLTDFGAAEQAGMAFRITGKDVVDDEFRPGLVYNVDDIDYADITGDDTESTATADPYELDVTDGRFEKLVVAGVKTTMDHEQSARELRELFEAHHFTDGLEFLEVGTPTNNHDRESGYSSADDPEASRAVETRARSRVAHGDNSAGDRLARALAIDPDPNEEHVFGWIENADKTEWLDGWHARSALWPATAGYYLQNMLIPNPLAETQSLWSDDQDAPTMGDVSDYIGWYEAYGRHFVNYVSPYGPLPSIRIDRQPYGVLPAMPLATARRDVFEDDPISWGDVRTASYADYSGSSDGDGAGEGSDDDGDGGDDDSPSPEERRKIREIARKVEESGGGFL